MRAAERAAVEAAGKDWLRELNNLYVSPIIARALIDADPHFAALALRAGLAPIVCVGETLEEREAGRTMERVLTQIRDGLDGLGREDMDRVGIAYEPSTGHVNWVLPLPIPALS